MIWGCLIWSLSVLGQSSSEFTSKNGIPTYHSYYSIEQNAAIQYNAKGQIIHSFPSTPLLDKRLKYFDLRFQDYGVELIWKKSKSKSSLDYRILRSQDGIRYEIIGTVGKEKARDDLYRFTDHLPKLGENSFVFPCPLPLKPGVGGVMMSRMLERKKIN